MIYERRVILSLLGAGRITAAEAERLIAAWEDAREWAWIAIGCVAISLLQTHPHLSLGGLGGFLHTIVDHGARALHNGALIGLKKIGGSV